MRYHKTVTEAHAVKTLGMAYIDHEKALEDAYWACKSPQERNQLFDDTRRFYKNAVSQLQRVKR